MGAADQARDDHGRFASTGGSDHTKVSGDKARAASKAAKSNDGSPAEKGAAHRTAQDAHQAARNVRMAAASRAKSPAEKSEHMAQANRHAAEAKAHGQEAGKVDPHGTAAHEEKKASTGARAAFLKALAGKSSASKEKGESKEHESKIGKLLERAKEGLAEKGEAAQKAEEQALSEEGMGEAARGAFRAAAEGGFSGAAHLGLARAAAKLGEKDEAKK
jgi:hypothetical protein